MQLVTFTHGGKTRIGAVVAEEVVDVSGQGGNVPSDMLAFLEQGTTALEQAREVCASGRGRLALADVHLEAPIRRPPKILAVGLNYRDHIEETGRPMPQVPMIFNKQSTAVTGPGGAIWRPKDSVELDYEGELGVVIGKRCRRVPKDQAASVIAGYTIVNDVSVRDWQARSATTTMGKSWDTHCPMGPYIVTTDEVPDPHCLDSQNLGEWRIAPEFQYHPSHFQLLRYCGTSVHSLYPRTRGHYRHRHAQWRHFRDGSENLAQARRCRTDCH